MIFDPHDISQGELHALQNAADKAWGDDTRHPEFHGDQDKSKGQCYVTSFWLTKHFGGFVGNDKGHYVWVSPDKKYVIDLTGDKHKYIIYKSIKHPLFKNVKIEDPKANPRAERFADRAETIFGKLDHFSKVAMDYAGDAYPAEEPQAQSDINMRDDNGGMAHDRPESETLNFVYHDGKIIVDDKPHEHLVDEEATGPIALGTVQIDTDDHATWTVETNIGLDDLSDILKKYCEAAGLTWGGVSNTDGIGLHAKKSFLYVVQQGDDVYLSHKQDWSRIASRLDGEMTVGTFSVFDQSIALPDRAFSASLLESLHEYAEDNGLNLVLAGNDNVIKRIEDLQEGNFSNPNPADPDNSDGQFFNDALENDEPKTPQRINGLWECDQCGRLIPSYHELIDHQTKSHDVRNKPTPINEEEVKSGFPEPNPDATFPPKETPRQPQGVGEITFSASRTAADFDPASVIPFAYDIEKDKIFAGEQGMSTEQLADALNASEDPLSEDATVMGIYDRSNGKVTIKTNTSVPYTVRHMIRLWYYQHQNEEVKSVELELPDGSGTTRLAGTKISQVGDLVFAGAMCHPDVLEVSTALMRRKAGVFVVGDAITDAEIEGDIPENFELKVTNISKQAMVKFLEKLGGPLSLAGYEEGSVLWRGTKISVSEDIELDDHVDLLNGRFTYGT